MKMRINLWLGMVLLIAVSGCQSARFAVNRANYVIGYTDMQCDDSRGQFYNWRTSRAMIVRADGSGRREIGASLITGTNTWTQFASWWPDGRRAVLHSS
jgi:hypothetical protein